MCQVVLQALARVQCASAQQAAATRAVPPTASTDACTAAAVLCCAATTMCVQLLQVDVLLCAVAHPMDGRELRDEQAVCLH